MEPPKTDQPNPGGGRLLGARPLGLGGLRGKSPLGPGKAIGATTGVGKVAMGRPAVVSLNWGEQDIENRSRLFQGGRFTSVNKAFSFCLGLLLATVFFGIMLLLYNSGNLILHDLGQVFVRPNNLFATVPATLFFFWGSTIVALKVPKLRLQRLALDLAAVPQHHEFILNEATAKTVLERMSSLVDDTRHFILLNRIDRALSNLQNIGGVSDVSSILKAQAENDENHIASSYALINAMIWAIPVLGFVGTVLGLKLAMGKFDLNAASTAAIQQSLGPVVAGLSTAFETTLVGLVFALILHLLSDLIQQKETDFLDECNDYCHAHVISRLRVRAKDESL